MSSLPDVEDKEALAAKAAAESTTEPPATPELDTAKVEWLLRTGDNTLILGHRVSEWCGHGPALEEDIALANTALDLIGQTQMWLGLAAELRGDTTADHLAFRRDAADFRNVMLVERPNGDFGRTLMRQFLFDAFHYELLKQLKGSSDVRVAEIAEKAIKEVAYHLERSSDLVIRLGDGSEESHRRMQAAADNVWSYTGELFLDDEVDAALAEAKVAPLPSSLKAGWDAVVDAVFTEGTLTRPEGDFHHEGGKRGIHTEHLGFLLAEMQFLQRAYPDAKW